MHDASIQAGFSVDDALQCLAIAGRLLGISLDATQLKLRFVPNSSAKACLDDIVKVATEVGLRSALVKASANDLDEAPVPLLAELTDGRTCVVARVAPDRLLIQLPFEKTPRVLTREEFSGLWTGRIILIASRSSLPSAATKGLGWFLPAIQRHRLILAEVLVASFFLQILALASPLLFQVVIDKVLIHHGDSTLDVLCFGLFAVATFEAALGLVRTYLLGHTASRIDASVGSKLFRHLFTLPLGYFHARRSGDTLARVRELESIRSFITGTALTVAIDVVFAVVFVAVMAWYSWLLTAIVMMSLPLYGLLQFFLSTPLRNRLNDKFARSSDSQALLVESITGVETVKGLGIEPQLQRTWEDQLAAQTAASFSAVTLQNIATQASSYISKLTMLLLLWFGARMVMDGDLTIGQLVAFNLIAARLNGPILRLVQLSQDFQQASMSISRLGDILETPGEGHLAVGRHTSPKLKGRITFDNVTFRFRPDREPVLRNISLDIRPGEVIGVVGSSGSGKSTLVKLIQGLYIPQEGRLSIDGNDLSILDIHALRRQIGVVMQDTMLFAKSIRENIAVRDPGIPMTSVIAAARLAGAHDFISALPEGYETAVGEHGATLSGGQRQRIAIARALVSNPRILILDEATSALDYESEAAISQNMGAICEGRTVVIVAHRLSAVKKATRIAVIERGRLIELGAPSALLTKNGRYSALVALQGGGSG